VPGERSAITQSQSLAVPGIAVERQPVEVTIGRLRDLESANGSLPAALLHREGVVTIDQDPLGPLADHGQRRQSLASLRQSFQMRLVKPGHPHLKITNSHIVYRQLNRCAWNVQFEPLARGPELAPVEIHIGAVRTWKHPRYMRGSSVEFPYG
jgi:hypothetical protein